MRLPIFCGLKETLRCGSRLGGSRSARRTMPPYLGFSPAAAPWAKASDPSVDARCTRKQAMTAIRHTRPGILKGPCVRTMHYLVSDVVLAHRTAPGCHNRPVPVTSRYHQLGYFSERIGISHALCKAKLPAAVGR